MSDRRIHLPKGHGLEGLAVLHPHPAGTWDLAVAREPARKVATKECELSSTEPASAKQSVRTFGQVRKIL
jgi:hypothetical protein